MTELTAIPEHLLRMEMLNLDTDGYLPSRPKSDASWTALNNLPFLIRQAQIAGASSASWRDKLVGASAYSLDIENSRGGVISGFNIRTHDENDMNIHAEQMAIERAKYKGFKNIAALAVWGEPESDVITGETPITLIPCRLCLDYMKKSLLITRRTAILSGDSDFSNCQLYGLDDLERYYDTNRVEEPIMQRINLRSDVLESPDYDDAVTFLLLAAWTRLNPDAPHASEFRKWIDEGQLTVSE